MNSDITVYTINLNGPDLPGWPINLGFGNLPVIIPRGWKLVIEVDKNGLGTAIASKSELDDVTKA